MQRLYMCILQEHDLRLVVVGAVICLLSCYVTVMLLARAREMRKTSGIAWLSAASVVFGSGVWATHFIAELAFRPGIPIDFSGGLTVLSVVISIMLSGIGFAVSERWQMPLFGGALIGVAIAPGAMLLALILCSASSSARLRIIIRNAPFDAQ